MGLIAIVKSFTRTVLGDVKLSDVKVDPGGGPNITGEHFSAPGDDSQPLPGDTAALMGVQRSGGAVAVGYADTVSSPVARPGEKRVYARNAAGEVVCAIWLKADGSIVGSNSAGDFELESSGDFVANGATMTTDGDVVTSDGVSLRNHIHAYTWTDPAGSGNTAPPT